MNDTATALMDSEVNKTYQEGELFTWHGTELILLPAVMIVGIPGNLLVFYIYHFRWRSSTVTLFKKMLSILDLSNLVLALPSLLYNLVNPESQGFLFNCIFVSFVSMSTAIAAGCLLLIIAVDRYMRLCLLRQTGIGSKLAMKLFAAGVILACLLFIPTIWIYDKSTVVYRHYGVKLSSCLIRSEFKRVVIVMVYFSTMLVVFMAVVVALFVFYAKIIVVLRKLVRKRDELKRRPFHAGDAETPTRHKQSEVMQKSAVVFIAITLVFIASYAPYLITITFYIANQSLLANMSPGMKAIYDLAKRSPLASNVANPFIYSFTSEQFRQEVKNIFTVKACKSGVFRRKAFSESARSRKMSEIP